MLKIDVTIDRVNGIKATVTITAEEVIKYFDIFQRITSPETKLEKSGSIIQIPDGVNFEEYVSVPVEKSVSDQIEILRKMAKVIEQQGEA